MCECSLALHVQIPITLRNIPRPNLSLQRIFVRQQFSRQRHVYHSINDRVRDVYTVWCKFSCKRQRQRSQSVFRGCEGREFGACFDGCCRASDDERGRVYRAAAVVCVSEEEREGGLRKEESALAAE